MGIHPLTPPLAPIKTREEPKIYLNLEKCVFVLGINRHELERNIASVLPEPIERDQRQIRAHEYIEKLCGNIVRLPYPSPKAQPLLVNKWLGSLDDIRRDEILRLIKDHAFLPLNPRRIKMWCNTVMQLHDHRVMESGSAPPVEEMPALALAAALHTFYPGIHQNLSAHTSFLAALKRWCDASERMEPELDVFAGVMRVFVTTSFITALSFEERIVNAVLRRRYRQDYPRWDRKVDLEFLEADPFSSLPDKDLSELLSQQTRLENNRLDKLGPILRRAIGWGETSKHEDDDITAEPAKPKRIPLLTDPSSLSYFHPQRLVAEESISEVQIKPYLHLD